MATRLELTKRIQDFKSDISLKDIRIGEKINKSRFKGLTINQQIKLGSSKTKQKQFRRTRKKERRESLNDVGILTGQREDIRIGLMAAEDDLFVFDNQFLGEGKI